MSQKTSPFKLADAVSENKKDLIRSGEAREEDYEPWLVNKSLSLHADCVLYVNEMNCLPELPRLMQHDYYLESLRPRRRWSKWPKAEKVEDEKLISDLYGYRPGRSREALKVLRHEQIIALRQLMIGTKDE